MLGDLSERDRAILALETAWPRHGGAKEEVIRAQLGMSAARYYQPVSYTHLTLPTKA